MNVIDEIIFIAVRCSTITSVVIVLKVIFYTTKKLFTARLC